MPHKYILLLLFIILSIPSGLWALPFFASSGNPSNDKLLDMPEKGQAAMLSKATHYQCLGKNPFYMGTANGGVNNLVSFWSITCDNGGKKFLVVIAPDANGNTRIFDCDHIPNHRWECYSKIKE